MVAESEAVSDLIQRVCVPKACTVNKKVDTARLSFAAVKSWGGYFWVLAVRLSEYHHKYQDITVS